MLKMFATALAVAAMLHAAPARAADLPAYPFIHVTAAADLHVMPDTGEIDFDIVSTDADLDSAWKLVHERLTASRALLAAQGVKVEDVSVQDVLRRPFRSRTVACTALIQSLMGLPNVESLAVAFSRSDADKIEAELVNQALGAARVKAQNIAFGIGAKLGPAGGVALAPLKNLANAMGLASDAPRYPSVLSPRDPQLVGVQKFVQGVDVIYRIGK
jgi:uncharacterized protein YggE